MNKLSVLQNLKKVNAKPYPHVIIENALDENIFNELKSKLPESYVAGQPVGPDQSKRVKYHVLQEDDWPISNLWKEFFEFHTSKEFFDQVLDMWEPFNVKYAVARDSIVIGKGKAYGKANCYTDCQFVRHNVVPEGATTRTPHVDNKNEVYAGLLYFKHDNSTGGGFNIHKQPFESGWDSKQNNELYEPGPIVDTCEYKDNNFVMFFNQKYAVHSVEPRAGVQSPRWSINIIGRWTQNRNW
jgi:hypothetical protein